MKQQVHQDEYFRSKSHEKNIKFNKELSYKKYVLMAPSPDSIKLTLQHKRLECKQVEVQHSNMKALDNDSHIVSHQLLHEQN